MSADIDKTSETYSLSVSSLLVRTLIYSGFFAGILASFYDFKLNNIVTSRDMESSNAIQDLDAINRAQQNYYAVNQKFYSYGEHDRYTDSIEELGVRFKAQQGLDSLEQAKNTYYYQFCSSMTPVQTSYNHREPAQFESTIAVAQRGRSKGGKIYIGAVFAFKDDLTHRLKTKSAICETERIVRDFELNIIMPSFDGREIKCPPGATLLRQYL